ncbi:MAG: hypothetical protein ACOYN5_15460 [Bacteroidales bacterium]
MKDMQKLNEFDILDLLNEYHSELRKLDYKATFVKSKIAELEAMFFTVKSGKGPEIAEKEAVSQISETVVTESNQTKSQEPAVKTRKPYPLSRYDQIILQVIEDNGRAMLSKDIVEKTQEKVIEEGLFESEEKTKSKINQCLVKLANRRGDIRKVNHKGRGFAYAIPVWFDERGRIMKGHGLKVTPPQA